jgi:hypothetical protein
MTNHHVVEDLLAGTKDPKAVVLRFDYEVGTDGAQFYTATLQDIETLRERLTLTADPRDILAARDSLKQLLGLRLLDP